MSKRSSLREKFRAQLSSDSAETSAFMTVIGLVFLVGLIAIGVSTLSGTTKGEDRLIGEWGAGEQSLTLSENGEARGTDGCNGQGSEWSYRVRARAVSFEGFVGTKMACPDENGEYKDGWLGQATWAKFIAEDYEELFFYDREGRPLGSMERVDSDSTDPASKEPKR